MKVAYSMPTDWAVTVVGTDASLVTPSADLFNGRPMDATRLILPSDWVGGVTDVVRVQFMRGTAFSPGLVGLIGANFLTADSSAGFKLAFTGRRAGDAGFTYDLGNNCGLVRTAEVEYDGSIKALGMCADGLDQIIGFEMAIYNDQNGSSPLAPGDAVDLGKPWASPATEIDVEEDWDQGDSDGDVPSSVGWQPWATPYPPGRVMPVRRRLIDVQDAFLTSSTPSYQALRRYLANGKVSIHIPRWRDSDTGALDENLMHQSAIFGTAKFSKLSHTGADYFDREWNVTEVPALLAE